jgi:YVTN family beta-propeller protein
MMMRMHAMRRLPLLCVLLLAACGSSATTGNSHPHSTPTPSQPSVGTVSATIPGLGTLSDPYSFAIAADDTAVWVYNGESGKVIRVDPKTNQVVATIAVGQGCIRGVMCGYVAIGQGAVWVTSGSAGTVTRIDPQTNQAVATISFGPNAGPSVSVSPGAVWVANYGLNSLSRIDPLANRVVATLPNQPGAGATSFGAGSLWMCNVHGDTDGLVRVDPATNKVQAQLDVSANQGLEGYQVMALAQAVWVVASDGTTTALERIDPATTTVSVSAEVPGIGLAADEQGVWGLSSQGLLRFNPQTAQVEGRLMLQGGAGIALGAGSVWVAKSDGTLLRITPTA